MEKLKSLYFESYFSSLIKYIKDRIFPSLKEAFLGSFLMLLWRWFDEKIIKSPIVKLIFDPEYISGIWYKSFFYRRTTLWIRKVSYSLPKASICFESIYTGIFISILIAVPDFIWNDMFWITLFIGLALFYLSRNIRNRMGTVFALVNVVLMLFLILIELALPYSAVVSLMHLLIGIDLFFLISFSVKKKEDLKGILFPVFITSVILCGVGIVQNIVASTAATAVFRDGISFGEILMLIFPFVFVYTLEYFEKTRKALYAAFVFIVFFNAVIATQSKAALIGFIVEVAVFVITDIKLIPSLIVLMPFGLSSLIENIRSTWYAATSYGNVINNFINLSRRIWTSGFGVDSQKIMSFYNSEELRSVAQNSFIKIPIFKITPFYINFVIDIGAIFMILFLAYILRLAHSSLTMLFTGDKRYKKFVTAGLATLVAISVSSFFETTIFASRTMLIYWAMLGIIRAVRIMNLGVYES